jgi:hypothetical protein
VRLNSANISSVIQSTNFNGNSNWIASNPGDTGWAINQAGEAVFNTVLVRNPSNIASYALGNSTTYSGQGSFNFNGTAAFYVYGNYYPKAPYGKTTSVLLCVDIESAATTSVVTLKGWGSYNGLVSTYTLYDKGQNLQQKSFSGSVAKYFIVGDSYYWWTVEITNNGAGVAGNPRISIMEIVS